MGPLEEVRKYGSGEQGVSSASEAVPGTLSPYAQLTKMKGPAAIQNNFYDGEGRLHYQVDFATHGMMPSGHWHELFAKGDAGSGHSATGGNAVHYPPSTAPAHFHQTVGNVPLAQEVANMNKDLPSKPAQRQAVIEQAIGKLAASQGVEPAVVKKDQARMRAEVKRSGRHTSTRRVRRNSATAGTQCRLGIRQPRRERGCCLRHARDRARRADLSGRLAGEPCRSGTIADEIPIRVDSK